MIFNILKKKKIKGQISILREFQKPPFGGGNQFMLALKKELSKKHFKIKVNKINRDNDAYLFDSIWLNQKLLKKLDSLDRPLIGHRLDGPTQMYRSGDNQIDNQIFKLNDQYASVSIIQSKYALNALNNYEYYPKNPKIITNAVDNEIFYPKTTHSFNPKIRLISSSWSSNPMKGGPAYHWLDKNLNFDKFEYFFIGRVEGKFNNIKIIPPQNSFRLANHLRNSDIYITATENDSCSNALIEAMACGLPAIYKNSGGSSEIVLKGGEAYNENSEIPLLIEKILSSYSDYKKSINLKSISEVADDYVKALGML